MRVFLGILASPMLLALGKASETCISLAFAAPDRPGCAILPKRQNGCLTVWLEVWGAIIAGWLLAGGAPILPGEGRENQAKGILTASDNCWRLRILPFSSPHTSEPRASRVRPTPCRIPIRTRYVKKSFHGPSNSLSCSSVVMVGKKRVRTW